MKARALTIAELERVNYVTGRNSSNLCDKLQELAMIATDAHAERRREAQRCAVCEYLCRYCFAGQAFTQWKCQLCGEDQPMHHNTAVPSLCSGCARTYALCVECGGDLETQHRGRKTGRRPKIRKKGTGR